MLLYKYFCFNSVKKRSGSREIERAEYTRKTICLADKETIAVLKKMKIGQKKKMCENE